MKKGFFKTTKRKVNQIEKVGSEKEMKFGGQTADSEDLKVQDEQVNSNDSDSGKKKRRKKLANLCDPEQGQLFANFDRFDDWDEFEDARKD